MLALKLFFAIILPIAWDVPTSGNVAGYKVHVGTAAGSYTTHLDVGNVTQYDISLPDTTTGKVYVAVTAYNDGTESSVSNEVIGVVGFITAPRNLRKR